MQQKHRGEEAFTFEGTIYTDGVGVSIVKQRTKRKSRKKGTENKPSDQQEKETKQKEQSKLSKMELVKIEKANLKRQREKEKEEKSTNKKAKKTKKEIDSKPERKGKQKKKEPLWPYITDWTPEQSESFRGKCVLIDPNRRDLLYAMHENSTPEKPNILRYTWNRQMKEMDTRGRRKLRLKLENKLYVDNPNLKTAVDLHSSTTSSKSITLTSYVLYLRSRSTISHYHQLDSHYEQLIFVSFE